MVVSPSPPPFWRSVSHFNPVLYLVSGFRRSFYRQADVAVGVSLAAIGAFLEMIVIAATGG